MFGTLPLFRLPVPGTALPIWVVKVPWSVIVPVILWHAPITMPGQLVFATIPLPCRTVVAVNASSAQLPPLAPLSSRLVTDWVAVNPVVVVLAPAEAADTAPSEMAAAAAGMARAAKVRL
jgi:hypothetical protein